MGDMEDESLAEPVGSLQNKWRLLPHFLAMRGLMKQVFFAPQNLCGSSMTITVDRGVLSPFALCHPRGSRKIACRHAALKHLATAHVFNLLLVS